MKTFYFFILLPILVLSQQRTKKLPQLEVSKNKRYLQTLDQEPFFWMGDTAWLMFSKLSREEAVDYLDDRQSKGFNVIQVMVLHQLNVKNHYGDPALADEDISRPLTTPGNSSKNKDAYDFWDHVDHIVDLAAERGIYVAMVPVWGSNLNGGTINVENATAYADWLSKRYAKKSNIIWLNGGDTKGNENLEIWNAIGNRIKKNTPNKLMTFHPFGRMKSSTWFHNAKWLDFNMFQSGHRRYDQEEDPWAHGQDNYKYVAEDYALKPIKPTIDGEPSYEGIPQGLHDPKEPYWNADDVRRYGYWSVFAGAFGFTYGHSAIMQMHQPEDESPAYGVKEYWREALDANGAKQMQHLKRLLLSKPFFERVPDQSLITHQGEKYNYQIATRGKDYAFIYTYTGREIRVRMGRISGKKVDASWYNPRNGKYISLGTFSNKGILNFDPPGDVKDGNDWVLVLEKSKDDE